MERKGNKPSSSDDFSEGSVPQTWEERRIVSASELFDKLSQIPQRRPEAQRELTGSEFLEFLKRQEAEGCRPEAGMEMTGSEFLEFLKRELTGSEFLEFLKRQEAEGCRPEAQRELTGSEFLEFLKRQVAEGCRPEAGMEMTGSEFLEFLKRVLIGSEFLEFLKRQEAEGCRPEAGREMTGSEFLEFLKRQEPEGCRSSKEVNSGQGSIGKQRNQNYQTVAIDQCDITSSVDYGSRDYYCPSTNSADVPYTQPKENEMDDLYKNCTDTRGNWWHGSFYY